MTRLVAVVLVWFASCGVRDIELAHDRAPDAALGDARGGPIPGLRALRVAPSSIEVTYDGAKLDRTPTLEAIGTFDSGERDVTREVEWTLVRTDLGAISAGRFTSAAVGGKTEVRARAGELVATARLRVRLEVVRERGQADGLSALFERAATAPQPSAAPSLVYPPDDAHVPNDFAPLHFQWRAPAELDGFELRIDSADAELRYYTDGRSWLEDDETSRFFAPSHAGESVRVQVRALARAEPEVVYESEPITLRVSESRLSGAVYYWSSSAQGIKRSELGASRAIRVLPAAPATEPAGCVGCHVVSRDGTRIAVADERERLAVFSLPELAPGVFEAPMPKAPPTPPPMSDTSKGPMGMAMMPGMQGMQGKAPRDYGWGSFSPDGTRLAYADKGKLHIIDVTNGTEPAKLMSPPDSHVTHPDWSPDGRTIAVSYAMMKQPKGNKLVRGTGIARFRLDEAGIWSGPEDLVPSSGADDTLAFPSFSPDGRWIAFSRAIGGSKDSASSELWVVAADGSAPPVRLDRAHVPGFGDSMPTWPAPGFVAFSSTRDYGDVLTGTQRDQLWLTAIDVAALDARRDPSSPAVWLPFQEPAESNHRAFWAPSGCVALVEQCNGRDDDCDDAVDEACCKPELERCDDDVDNDCDGVANEGCGCAEVEQCDNGLDDDCDRNVDEECKE